MIRAESVCIGRFISTRLTKPKQKLIQYQKLHGIISIFWNIVSTIHSKFLLIGELSLLFTFWWSIAVWLSRNERRKKLCRLTFQNLFCSSKLLSLSFKILSNVRFYCTAPELGGIALIYVLYFGNEIIIGNCTIQPQE